MLLSDYKSQNTLILLHGLRQSGKDTAANVFTEEAENKGISVKRLAFGDELRKHLWTLNPIVGIRNRPDEGQEVRWRDAIERHGYDRAKEIYTEMRRLLQVYGTEVVRNLVSDSFWVDKVHDQAHKFHSLLESGVRLPMNPKVAIVTDCRFPNEVDVFEIYKRATVRKVLVTRKDLKKDDYSHASDQVLWNKGDEGVDTLENDGTLEEYVQKVKTLASVYYEPALGTTT